MKKTTILYWVFTGLFAALMIFSSIPDANAVQFIGSLGYPAYFVTFISIAKIAGIIAILVPGFPRLKEWAYAGLAFDLIGATYSQIAVAGFKPDILFMLLPFGLGVLSYIFHHRLLNLKTSA